MSPAKQPVELPEFARNPARRLWGTGGMDRPMSLRDLTDDGLTRMRKQVERAIEDGLTRPSRVMPVVEEQYRRERLRMRYGAVDLHLGTDSYDRYMRHDEAPTYALAALMDLGHHVAGRRHVLDWAAEPRFVDWYRSMPCGVEFPVGLDDDEQVAP